MKPPKIAASLFNGLRPRLGIGIAIGALLVIGSQASGSDSAFAMVLGGGAGIALGLTRRSGPEKLSEAAKGEDDSEVNRR